MVQMRALHFELSFFWGGISGFKWLRTYIIVRSMSVFNLMLQQKDSMLRKHFFTRCMITKRISKKASSEVIFRGDAYCEVPSILFMIQSLNIWIFILSTDSPSNKPPRILLSSRAPARCDDTGTKLNMLYRVYIKVSQNEIQRTNVF